MFKRINLLLLLIFVLPAVSYSQGNSLLWRISGKNLKHTSYLYGTMHSSDPRVFHFSDSVYPAFEMCDGFAMEVLIDHHTQETMMQNVFMKDDETLKNLLTPLQYDSLQKYAYSNTGLNISFFEKMKPLYVAIMLEGMSNSDSATENTDDLLDQYLHLRAEKMNKQIFGLETIEEQMNVFDAVTYKEQAEILMQSIRSYTADAGSYETMVEYYLDNDLYNMMKFENDFALPDSLYRALITNRNLKMVDRIDTMIHRRSMFIAVGAGHLGSEGGLVELLRNRGYTVLPVIPVFNNYLKDGWYQFQSQKNNFTVSFPGVPAATQMNFKGNIIYEYSLQQKETLSAPENFTVYVFPLTMNDGDIINFLELQKLNTITFTNATGEKYFNFLLNEKTKGKGVMLFSGENRYVIIYSSSHKTKNANRFTASFDLQ